MLWNGQHWHNNKEIPGELGTIKKKKKNACSPDIPPETIPADAPA
jgi:hypothetical protein